MAQEKEANEDLLKAIEAAESEEGLTEYKDVGHLFQKITQCEEP